MVRTLLTGLLDLLAPPQCAACALPLPSRALADADPNDGAACPRGFCDGCGLLLEPAPAELRPPTAHAAAFLYQGPLADAIRRFKYNDQRQLLDCLGPLLVTGAAPYAGEIDAVVPVPLHARKLRQRGWNPPALLARPVARMLGAPMCSAWLERTRETTSQAGLSREARARNVRGAFRAKPVAPVRVLLVDDVRTTGATLLEAAMSLEKHGHQVSTLALAWALQSDPDCANGPAGFTRRRCVD